MYNIDFLPQLEKFRRYMSKSGITDSGREASEEASRRYFPYSGLESVECYEDINGEWVPKQL